MTYQVQANYWYDLLLWYLQFVLSCRVSSLYDTSMIKSLLKRMKDLSMFKLIKTLLALYYTQYNNIIQVTVIIWYCHSIGTVISSFILATLCKGKVSILFVGGHVSIMRQCSSIYAKLMKLMLSSNKNRAMTIWNILMTLNL